MSKRNRFSVVPKTPGGQHLRFADVSADEIDFDDEVSVKSSIFRGRNKTPGNEKKIIVRKSTDLKKIKNIDARIEAIISSPMIEVRRRPLGQSQSFTSTDMIEQPRTPLHVPSSKDPDAVASRRMSTYVLSQFAPHNQSMPSLDSKRASVCPGVLNRRKLSSIHPNTPIRRTSFSGLNSQHVAMKLLQSEATESAVEPMEVDENSFNSENIPPVEHRSSTIDNDEQISKDSSSLGQFRVLLGMETARLSAAKSSWEDVITEEKASIPEIALESIRVATGKCGLLLSKKFPFFAKLIDLADQSLKQQDTETGERTSASGATQQKVDINDLLGYWSTIAFEIANIDGAFERLRDWRETSGWAIEHQQRTPARGTSLLVPGAASRLPRGSSVNAETLTPKSAAALRGSATKPVKRLIRTKNKPVSKLRPPKVVVSKFAQFRAEMKKKQNKSDEPSTGAPVMSPKQRVPSSNNRNSNMKSPMARKSASNGLKSPIEPSETLRSPLGRTSLTKPPSPSGIEMLSALGLTASSDRNSASPVTPSSSQLLAKRSSSALPVNRPRSPTPTKLLNDIVSTEKKPRGRPRKSIVQLSPVKSMADSVAKRPRGRPPKSAQNTPVGLMSPFIPQLTPRGRPRKPTFRSVAKRALSSENANARGPPRKSVVMAVPQVQSELANPTESPLVRTPTPFVRNTPNNRRSTNELRSHVPPSSGRRRGRPSNSLIINSSINEILAEETSFTDQIDPSKSIANLSSEELFSQAPLSSSRRGCQTKATPNRISDFGSDLPNLSENALEHPLNSDSVIVEEEIVARKTESVVNNPSPGQRRHLPKSIVLDSQLVSPPLSGSKHNQRKHSPKSGVKGTPGRKSGFVSNMQQLAANQSQLLSNENSVVAEGRVTPSKEAVASMVNIPSTGRRGRPSKAMTLMSPLSSGLKSSQHGRSPKSGMKATLGRKSGFVLNMQQSNVNQSEFPFKSGSVPTERKVTPLKEVEASVVKSPSTGRRGRPPRTGVNTPGRKSGLISNMQQSAINQSEVLCHNDSVPDENGVTPAKEVGTFVGKSPSTGRRGRPSKSAVLNWSSLTPKSSQRGRPPKSGVKGTPGRELGLNLNLPTITENNFQFLTKNEQLDTEAATPMKEADTSKLVSTRRTPRGRPSKVASNPEVRPETPSLAISVVEERWAVPGSRPPTQKRPRSKDVSASLLESSTTSETNISQLDFSSIRTPLSALHRLSPPPRPLTGTPRPKLPHTTSTPAVNLSLRQSLLMKMTGSAIASPPPAKRGRKSVRFPASADALSLTPHGHSAGSGSPRETFPVTPHTSLGGDPSKRVSRGRRMLVNADSPVPSALNAAPSMDLD